VREILKGLRNLNDLKDITAEVKTFKLVGVGPEPLPERRNNSGVRYSTAECEGALKERTLWLSEEE
jgi:hypothetical protein